MAIRKLTTRRAEVSDELLQALKEEMERPEGVSPPPSAPIIYLEVSDGPDNYTHWYVIWDRFAEVDEEERSRLIMRAVEGTRRREEALRVTIAMGVTSDEPKAMGLAG